MWRRPSGFRMCNTESPRGEWRSSNPTGQPERPERERLKERWEEWQRQQWQRGLVANSAELEPVLSWTYERHMVILEAESAESKRWWQGKSIPSAKPVVSDPAGIGDAKSNKCESSAKPATIIWDRSMATVWVGIFTGTKEKGCKSSTVYYKNFTAYYSCKPISGTRRN